VRLPSRSKTLQRRVGRSDDRDRRVEQQRAHLAAIDELAAEQLGGKIISPLGHHAARNEHAAAGAEDQGEISGDARQRAGEDVYRLLCHRIALPGRLRDLRWCERCRSQALI